ncbi:MAG: amidohydrolase family protein [Rhodoplanes sp.]|nr:amidohydrolase family protein [Rhodoplanes sp.]NVO12914.1 amidohydrolase family protein [Rhodoplanes sp.]
MNRRESMITLAGITAGLQLCSLPGVFAAEGPVPTAKAPAVPGPVPDTRKPVFRMPAGAVDTHMHIYGPISKYPYSEDRSYTPPEATVESFRKLQGILGVQRAVIVNATIYGTNNRIVTDAIAGSNNAYRGIATIDDKLSDRELEALDKAGIRGCRFTFLSRLRNAPDTSVFDRVIDQIKGLGWHVDIYLEADKLDMFAPRLRKLPIPYVIDHMGAIKVADGLEAPGFKALVELFKTDEKCWMKITGPERATAAGAPFTDVVPFARKLVETAPDRVLWGTDWPHPNVKFMPNEGDQVDLIPLYAPDPAVQRKLLVENPQKLFKFDPV